MALVAPGTKVWPLMQKHHKTWCEKSVTLNRSVPVARERLMDVPDLPQFSRFVEVVHRIPNKWGRTVKSNFKIVLFEKPKNEAIGFVVQEKFISG